MQLADTDGVLARQALAGDQYAFEGLLMRYSTPLFNFISRFLGDYDQASDILQQVFIQLHTSLPTLRTDKPLKAWLFQVARNRCLDELRRKHAIHFSELEIVNDDDELSPLAAIPILVLCPKNWQREAICNSASRKLSKHCQSSFAQWCFCATQVNSVSAKLGRPSICQRRLQRPTSNAQSLFCVQR